MPKLTIRLKGGQRDGEIIEGVDSRCARKELRLVSHWEAMINGKPRYYLFGAVSRNWVSMSVEIYTKIGKNSANQFEYLFDRSEEFPRCGAITKKGDRCMKESSLGLSQCKMHGRKQPN